LASFSSYWPDGKSWVRSMKVTSKYLLNLIILFGVSCGTSPHPATSKEKVLAAIRRLSSDMSYRLDMKTTGSTTTADKTRMEVMIPHRFRIVNNQFEMIIVGQNTYIRLPGEDWQKSSTAVDVVNLADPERLESYLRSARQVTDHGLEMIDNVPNYVYQAEINHPPSTRIHSTGDYRVKLWIGKTDGRLQKIEVSTAKSRVMTTVVFYDFQASLNITPPIT